MKVVLLRGAKLTPLVTDERTERAAMRRVKALCKVYKVYAYTSQIDAAGQHSLTVDGSAFYDEAMKDEA